MRNGKSVAPSQGTIDMMQAVSTRGCTIASCVSRRLQGGMAYEEVLHMCRKPGVFELDMVGTLSTSTLQEESPLNSTTIDTCTLGSLRDCKNIKI